MTNNRRDFLRIAGMAGAGFAGSTFFQPPFTGTEGREPELPDEDTMSVQDEEDLSIIGTYGSWGNSLIERELPEFSLRRRQWANLDRWRNSARQRLAERLAIPEMEGVPEVKVNRKYSYDGLQVEELSWQLPYGGPTEAILLKPQDAGSQLPGILAFHEHGGQKYFGRVKIARTADRVHPVVESIYERYYEGFAWANEIAKRGYVVLIPDAFTFGSRRVKLEDVPAGIRQGLGYGDRENPTVEEIEAYNQWAGRHEHIMAKSLFSAGTTWPGVFLGEDRKALDVLCAREDVDESRVGCGGLSGGGIRTVYMGGFDPRIKCAVCVGFMTTWKDLVLHHSWTHTWMTFTPLLPNELEFTEILGLRAPLPVLVQNNDEDPLFRYSEMKRADEIMREVYRISGGTDNYRCTFYPGPHKFDAAMQHEAFDWFDQWLKA